MQLLVVVLHREELLDEILSVLVELELTDSVVVESRSGLELLERDLPIFAGLRALIPGGIDFSRLVLCLLERAHQEEVMEAIGRVAEAAADDGGGQTNTAFLVPVTDAIHF